MGGIFLGGQLLGGLAGAAVGTALDPGRVMVGSAAGGLALVLAFGASWGDAPLLLFGSLRMRARPLGLLLGGLSLLSPLLHAGWLAAATLATGGLAGMVYGGHLPGRLVERVRKSRDARRVRRLRSRYRVIPGGRDRHGFQA